MSKVSHKKDRLQGIVGKNLYHFNSVYNSIRFLQESALLSRNYMVQKGIRLTPQLSDVIDLQHNIFDTIFLETEFSSSGFNRYGPVCFVLKSSLLGNNNLFPTGRFLRSNPEEWKKSTQLSEKYKLADEDTTGDCLVLSNTSGFIPISGFIEKILIAPSLQERAKAYHRKNHEEQNRWGKSSTGIDACNFDNVAAHNICDIIRERNYADSIPVEIADVGEAPLWGSKQSNWIEMMYFPGKLFSVEKEIDIVYNKRRYNFSKKHEVDAAIVELRQLYNSCFCDIDKEK